MQMASLNINIGYAIYSQEQPMTLEYGKLPLLILQSLLLQLLLPVVLVVLVLLLPQVLAPRRLQLLLSLSQLSLSLLLLPIFIVLADTPPPIAHTLIQPTSLLISDSVLMAQATLSQNCVLHL
jgi:hypothetical protein